MNTQSTGDFSQNAQVASYIIRERKNGKQFYAFIDTITPNEGVSILVLCIYDHKPSGEEDEQPLVKLQIDAEESRDATRVMLRLWNDITDKEDDSTEVITVVEQSNNG
jgi:hypothetical protein